MPPRSLPLVAPMQGTVIALVASPGTRVAAGDAIVLIESMKMEHAVEAERAGVVRALTATVGQLVRAGDVLGQLEELAEPQAPERPDEPSAARAMPHDAAASSAAPSSAAPPPAGKPMRADLREVVERHAKTHDAARPEAVARRHAQGRRTARENLAELLDPGSFVEVGPLLIAAQRSRRPLQELIDQTPADGLVGGFGRVAGRPVVALSYDYTVLAGTQGMWNHHKKDRLFELAHRQRAPVVIFAEGGGGRPGDLDAQIVAGLDAPTFARFAALSGEVPLVAIVSGRCFAGNAALAGCCDVIIATPDANLGMSGPAMIEGGGLGVVAPEDIGPATVQAANGAIDLVATDEAHAVALARQYLGYFQGPAAQWSAADPSALRDLIPEDRVRSYDMRKVVAGLCDDGAVLELRRAFAPGIITALGRVEGRPLGIVANHPMHLGGAIDADGADKAARFLQLCDAHDLPILFLCDTPGFMVGPDSEARAMVRHASRLFVTGANLTVPFFTIVVRKAYGLGAQAMAGGSFKAPLFTVAWPTGEIGAMGLEGAVKLGFRKELSAIADPTARQRMFEAMVAEGYRRGKALSAATYFELDEVIDPADSRRWIVAALAAAPAPARTGKKRPNIDTW